MNWREESINSDRQSGTEFVGLDTEFTTSCSLKLQPGRLYWATVRSIVELMHPNETIFVEGTARSIIIGKFLSVSEKKICLYNLLCSIIWPIIVCCRGNL